MSNFPPAAQRMRLSGPAFGPDEAIRRGHVDAARQWQAHVDARRIGNIQELSPEALASIDAWERVLGVGKYRGATR